MTTEKEETMSTTELIAEARDAADLEVLGEVLRRIYVEAREGVTTPAKARAGLIAVYEAGQRASVTTPTEAGDDKRKELIHVLFDQVPEDWDENDIGILADAIMPLLDATTPTEADDALNFLDEMNSEGRIEYSDYSALHDLISRHPQPEIAGRMAGKIVTASFEDGKVHKDACGLEDCECPDHEGEPLPAGTYITVRLDEDYPVGLWRVSVTSGEA